MRARIPGIRLAAWLIALQPALVAAQESPEACRPPRRADPDSLIRMNAPVLRFADLEEHFPTAPFFSALDGLDNDGDGRFDFRDPDEVSPRPSPVADGPPRASWERLDAFYHAGPLPFTDQGSGITYPPAPTVLHRTRILSDGDERRLWRFLRSDLEAWRRTGIQPMWESWRRSCRELRVLEYYLYYVDDQGLEGHEEDIEFVFVFLPADADPHRPTFRITVGAGHVQRTPNNVLVVVDDRNPANHRSAQEDLYSPQHVLVELGGHASAPDRSLRGSFQAGLDANWHGPEVWGTRDVLALTGTGFFGAYEPQMTLAREGSKRFRPRIYPEQRGGYRLVPVEVFARLDSALVSETASRDEVRSRLEDVLAHFPDAQVPSQLPDSAYDRLGDWTRGLCCGRDGGSTHASKHQPWKHEHFIRSPAAITKDHLYRPSTSSIMGVWDFFHLLSWSGTWIPEGPASLAAGLVIPVPAWLPARTPGFLTVEAGYLTTALEGGAPHGATISVLYDASYSRHLTWYGSLHWLSTRPTPEGDRLDHSWEVSGGLSALIWSYDDRPWWSHVANVVRLRVGPRIRLGRWDDLLRGSGLELRLGFHQ